MIPNLTTTRRRTAQAAYAFLTRSDRSRFGWEGNKPVWLAKQLQEIGIDVQLTNGGKELELDGEITLACREEKSGCYVSSVELACALHRYCFGGNLRMPLYGSSARRSTHTHHIDDAPPRRGLPPRRLESLFTGANCKGRRCVYTL